MNIILFLGQVISKEVISIDSSRIHAMKVWSVSKLATEIKKLY